RSATASAPRATASARPAAAAAEGVDSPSLGRHSRRVMSITTTTAAMTREALAKRIAEVALLRGEFTLRSGRKSNYYLDKYRFETQPDVLRALGEMFAKRIGDNVDRIAGAELGAVSLAAAASIASGKPFVIVRNQKKDYGTSKLV